jgi:hypothetical protein
MGTAIKKDDLVALVRGHACALDRWAAYPFEVGRIHRTLVPWAKFVCNRCAHKENALATRYALDPRGNTLPLNVAYKVSTAH